MTGDAPTGDPSGGPLQIATALFHDPTVAHRIAAALAEGDAP